MRSNKLQIFVLSKDRYFMLRETINSILPQLNGSIELIISDNSDTSSVYEMMSDEFKDIQCIRRDPPLFVHDHFLSIIEAATAEFVMIFHDDDIMMPNCISRTLDRMRNDSSLSAVGVNAFYMLGDTVTDKKILKSKNEILIDLSEDLFQNYLGLNSNGHPPFPNYIYRTAYLKMIGSSYLGCGKYGDLSLLVRLLKYGNILWLSEPTIYYRVHSNQDSSKENIRDRISLLNLMRENGINLKSKSVLYYKMGYLYNQCKNTNQNILSCLNSWKYRIILKYIICRSLYLFLVSSDFRSKILSFLEDKIKACFLAITVFSK